MHTGNQRVAEQDNGNLGHQWSPPCRTDGLSAREVKQMSKGRGEKGRWEGLGGGGERGKGGEGSCAISLPLRPFLLRLFLWLGSCSRNLLSLAAK